MNILSGGRRVGSSSVVTTRISASISSHIWPTSPGLLSLNIQLYIDQPSIKWKIQGSFGRASLRNNWVHRTSVRVSYWSRRGCVLQYHSSSDDIDRRYDKTIMVVLLLLSVVSPPDGRAVDAALASRQLASVGMRTGPPQRPCVHPPPYTYQSPARGRRVLS